MLGRVCQCMCGCQRTTWGGVFSALSVLEIEFVSPAWAVKCLYHLKLFHSALKQYLPMNNFIMPQWNHLGKNYVDLLDANASHLEISKIPHGLVLSLMSVE